MERFRRYLAAVDGNNDWSVVGPLYDEAFDADCVVVTADGEYDRAAWSQMVRGLVEKGAVASEPEILSDDGDEVTYRLSIALGDETLEMTARGTLRDGRLIRVEPVDPDVYSTLMDRSK